jgi:hypothetical protein
MLAENCHEKRYYPANDSENPEELRKHNGEKQRRADGEKADKNRNQSPGDQPTAAV